MSLNLELKIFYAPSFLGLAIEQVKSTYKIPISSYYLWPRTDAWEQIKLELESKPWVKPEEKIKLLNQTASIMNYWRKNRHNTTKKTLNAQFPELLFVNVVE